MMRVFVVVNALLSASVLGHEKGDGEDGKTTTHEKVQEVEDTSMKAGIMLKDMFMGGKKHMEKQGPQPLLVIGAGLPRTGTSSYKMALAMLGLETYHMQDVFKTPGHSTLWYKFLVERSITVDEVLDGIASLGFNATIDAPTAYFYKELMNRYPNAKVVLTVRDSAEKWADSYAGTCRLLIMLLQEVPFSLVPGTFRAGRIATFMGRGVNFPPDDDPSLLPDFYREWVAQVKATVPADNLLVFNAKDGWAPLCDFLSPIAESIENRCAEIQASGLTYPHANDSAKMQTAVVLLKTITAVSKAMPLLLLACVVLYCFRSGKKKLAAVRAKKKLY